MSPSQSQTKLSAVVVCYRDAPAVPIMYERLTKVFAAVGADYEIIFVNDASPDNAREVLAELAARDRKVVVINHTRNFGSQSGFTSGMRVATGDAVILLDGDLQDPPELIEDFVCAWRKGYEVVYGVRVRRDAPMLMRGSYRLFYRVFRAMSYVPVPVDAGDFSLLDRRVVDVLNAMPEKNRFVRGLRAWVGFRQTGVPYTRPERMFGRSSNSLFRNMDWAAKAIFSFSYAPLRMITIVALITVVLSLVLAFWQVAFRLFYPAATPSGLTTVILLILFLGGIQLLCLAVIGTYLAHIYDEVKHRPAYVVESILNAPAVSSKPDHASP